MFKEFAWSKNCVVNYSVTMEMSTVFNKSNASFHQPLANISIGSFIGCCWILSHSCIPFKINGTLLARVSEVNGPVLGGIELPLCHYNNSLVPPLLALSTEHLFLCFNVTIDSLLSVGFFISRKSQWEEDTSHMGCILMMMLIAMRQVLVPSAHMVLEMEAFHTTCDRLKMWLRS